MRFIHQDRDFADLLRIVARDQGLSPGLVEKDYWVTHTLWALHQGSLEVWFKGGTSLSKGFGLIRRFSEDLDLRIEAGSESGLPPVTSWTSENRGPVAQRRAFFEALDTAIRVPDAQVRLVLTSLDRRARGAEYRVEYPGRFLANLGPAMRPFVLLEVGVARVTPFATRALTSFVHESLGARGASGTFDDNRPHSIRCVHPVVTLIEKLDAISRRYPREPMEPATFIRHYEDAARIIEALDRMPALASSPHELAREMLADGQVRQVPSESDPGFALLDPTRRAALQAAHNLVAPMYWGPRLSLAQACETIRTWLSSEFPGT
jgi:hypothetical protein